MNKRILSLLLTISIICILCIGSSVYAAESRLPNKLITTSESLGIDSSKFIKRENIINAKNEKVCRYTYDDQVVIEVEQDTSDISNISHFVPTNKSDIAVYSEKDLNSEIQFIEKLSGMDKSYELTSSNAFDDDYWMLTWQKRTSINVLNQYDAIDAVYDRHTKALVAYSRFNDKPNTPKTIINSKDALKSLKNKSVLVDIKKVEDTDISGELSYVKKNYSSEERRFIDTNEVRLAYKFNIDSNNSAYVDAETGDVISLSTTRSSTAKAFSVNDGGIAFPDPVQQTNDATSCFDSLGYSTFTPLISNSSTLDDNVLLFLERSDAYGFYIACHGNQAQTKIFTNSGDNYWEIIPSQISGNWKFVFIDACWSANGTAWSNAFHIYNTSTNRAFLGWFDAVDGVSATEFTHSFFPEVKYHAYTSNIRNAAVWAATQVTGYTPIRFYGDIYYNGHL